MGMTTSKLAVLLVVVPAVIGCRSSEPASTPDTGTAGVEGVLCPIEPSELSDILDGEPLDLETSERDETDGDAIHCVYRGPSRMVAIRHDDSASSTSTVTVAPMPTIAGLDVPHVAFLDASRGGGLTAQVAFGRFVVTLTGPLVTEEEAAAVANLVLSVN
jgi:hypothetical protein